MGDGDRLRIATHPGTRVSVSACSEASLEHTTLPQVTTSANTYTHTHKHTWEDHHEAVPSWGHQEVLACQEGHHEEEHHRQTGGRHEVDRPHGHLSGSVSCGMRRKIPSRRRTSERNNRMSEELETLGLTLGVNFTSISYRWICMREKPHISSPIS